MSSASKVPSSALRLAYAVAWNRDPRTTWSHTPWSLREALLQRQGTALTDVHLTMPTWRKLWLKGWHITRHQQRWISGWGHSPLVYRDYNASMRQQLSAATVDAVLEIGDWGDAQVPSFVYQDYSYLHLEEDVARNGYWTPQFDYHSERMLRKRIGLQRRTIGRHAGIMSMSAWDAQQLVSTGLVDPARVHVVPPAINVSAAVQQRRPAQHDVRSEDTEATAERRVVFVGRDPWRFVTVKAGDVLIDAVRRVRDGGINARLVIVGPSWLPIPGDLPSWITLVPDATFRQVQQELERAAVLCMPSTFEAYGIAFLEALAAGIPVIGRNAFAMPEFIRHGDNGLLLSAAGGAQELAELLHQVLSDPTFQQRAQAQASSVRDRYSWDRVADDMVRIIGSTVAA